MYIFHVLRSTDRIVNKYGSFSFSPLYYDKLYMKVVIPNINHGLQSQYDSKTLRINSLCNGIIRYV